MMSQTCNFRKENSVHIAAQTTAVCDGICTGIYCCISKDWFYASSPHSDWPNIELWTFSEKWPLAFSIVLQ